MRMNFNNNMMPLNKLSAHLDGVKFEHVWVFNSGVLENEQDEAIFKTYLKHLFVQGAVISRRYFSSGRKHSHRKILKGLKISKVVHGSLKNRMS